LSVGTQHLQTTDPHHMRYGLYWTTTCFSW
jgi:hypothetical protein